MNGHFETNGIYPLSTQPAEGYGSDPLVRGGKVIISHANGKHLQINDSEQGYTLVESREGATKFDDHSIANLEAGKLIAKARAAHEAQKAA